MKYNIWRIIIIITDLYWVCTEQIHMINLFMARNPPVPLRTTSSLVWSWRLWIGRTPTSFVLQRWERSEVRRSSSCLMAGEVPLTTGVPSTPETSSPWGGALWPSTLYSHRETSVSAAIVTFSLPLVFFLITSDGRSFTLCVYPIKIIWRNYNSILSSNNYYNLQEICSNYLLFNVNRTTFYIALISQKARLQKKHLVYLVDCLLFPFLKIK